MRISPLTKSKSDIQNKSTVVGTAKADHTWEAIVPHPLTKLSIDGQRYEIFTHRIPAGKLLLRYEIVGELRIHEERYIVVQLKGRLDEDIDDDPKTLMNVLTRRELQVVLLVAEGLVNKQIADRLRISEWTVSTHLRRIFAKLGVDNRAEMVYKCFQPQSEKCYEEHLKDFEEGILVSDSMKFRLK